jgi:subtilisin family serine protease
MAVEVFMKKIIFPVLFILLGLAFVSPWQPAQAGGQSSLSLAPAYNSLPARDVSQKISPVLAKGLNKLQGMQMTTVIVTLRQQADLLRVGGRDFAAHDQAVLRSLKNAASATQPCLRKLLALRQKQGRLESFEALWVINGFSVTASRAVIEELAADPDVYAITPDALNVQPAAYGTPEANISVLNAPALWDQGFTGQGIVVASMDSGVDVNHPDLAARWRGGTNSWYDPYGQHPLSPVDPSGHGTWTMGVMVGGDAGGTSIGVAPGARWISVKIFNDSGSATATAIHKGFQWLLDPDGDPNTADAPRVVNNSWTFGSPGCNLEFEPDLSALRAAGILPVFAAGNGGPGSNTSYSPANNPSAFAVGSVDNNGLIASVSSRGPSSCGGQIFPDVVAPGVNIHTSDLFGMYFNSSGTSLAAPHVAGGLALLLQAYPNLGAAEQENALVNSAQDLGAAGPDNVYGNGRVDLLAAFNWIPTAPTLTPTFTATATATALPPTASPTATALLPTATATTLPPTATVLPPTATATMPVVSVTVIVAKTDHVGNLTASKLLSGTKWNSSVTILVHNGSEQPLAGATVSGTWSNGATVTCKTSSSGSCTLTHSGWAASLKSVTFQVTKIALTGYTYQPQTNHDPGTDSNGTTIVIMKP